MIRLSWADFEEKVTVVSDKIKADKFVPDCIIGIATGGLIPAALISRELEVVDTVAIAAHSYKKGVRGTLQVTSFPTIDLQNKKVLIVDEITETGATMETIIQLVQEHYKPAEIRSATIATNINSAHKPDYFSVEGEGQFGWIFFPWELKEFPEHP